MANAIGAVGHPDDENGAYLENPTPYAGDGWQKVWGFFDGVRGATDRVEGISGDIAGTANNITDAKRNIWELEADMKDRKANRTNERLTIARGDNVQLYYALAAGAVALVVVMVAT